MATSSQHPPFPSRPYTSGLGRTGGQSAFQSTPYNTHTPFNTAGSTTAVAGLGGTGPTQQQREAQRLERERHERAERERREAEERGVLEALSEEQREEVDEAVRYTEQECGQDVCADVRNSSHYSISTKTTTSTTTNSKSRSKP